MPIESVNPATGEVTEVIEEVPCLRDTISFAYGLIRILHSCRLLS